MNNIGHVAIESGLKNLINWRLKSKVTVSYNWMYPTPSVLAKKKPLVFVSSSGLMCSSRPDFDEQGITWSQILKQVLEVSSARSVLVCNLGANGPVDSLLDFDSLIPGGEMQLAALRYRKPKIWARGEISKNFIEECTGIQASSLGCPSFSLLTRRVHINETIRSPKRLLIHGDGYKFLELLSKKFHIQADEILWIPQSREEAEVEIPEGFNISRYMPTSLKDWQKTIKNFSPHLSIGTRLHGTFIALSGGYPSVLISGDLRSSELCELGAIPHFKSINEFDLDLFGEAMKKFNSDYRRRAEIIENQRKFLERFVYEK